jgi:hypothetical protein
VQFPFIQNLNNQNIRRKFMPAINRETLDTMRRQLAEDRALCANSPEAQQMLDVAESKINEVEESYARRNPVEALNAGLDEIEAEQIGKDSATGEELNEIMADTREFQEAMETMPVENQDTPLYAAALRCMNILKRNAVALADKKSLNDRMVGVFDATKNLRKEIEETERLIRANAEIPLGATGAVFQHFKDNLLPVLDLVLTASVGDILAAK